MFPISLHPAWYGLIDREWIDELDDTSFLTRCRAGTITRLELQAFVRQHHFYSKHFTRYLCALLANVSDERDRLALMQNLFEEMGFGAFGSIPHSVIYRNMMGAMNVRPEGALYPATARLVETMFECCTNVDPLVGLSALGLGAEAIVPHLYSQIVMGFTAVGEDAASLEFFRIHIEGDDEHAVTMRTIMQRELVADPSRRGAVRAAARRVLAARVAFFDDLTQRAGADGVREKASHGSIAAAEL